MYEKNFFEKYIEIDERLELSIHGLLNQSETYEMFQNNEHVINPFCGLLKTYEDIETIIKRNDINIFEYLYLNRYKIFRILFEEDKIIPVEKKMINKFSDYYYLYHLIYENNDILNFEYHFKFVNHLYDIIINTKFDIKKIILTKLMKCFIDNYEKETNEEEYELDKMNKICDDIIEIYKNEPNKNLFGLDIIYQKMTILTSQISILILLSH